MRTTDAPSFLAQYAVQPPNAPAPMTATSYVLPLIAGAASQRPAAGAAGSAVAAPNEVVPTASSPAWAPAVLRKSLRCIESVILRVVVHSEIRNQQSPISNHYFFGHTTPWFFGTRPTPL